MKCPGQDNRYWDSNAIFDVECPKCGNTVEFFKDDPKRQCKKCGCRILNPKMDFGCASHCDFAEYCTGEYPDDITKKGNL